MLVHFCIAVECEYLWNIIGLSRELMYQELEFNGLCHNKYKIQLIIMIENIQAVSSNT